MGGSEGNVQGEAIFLKKKDPHSQVTNFVPASGELEMEVAGSSGAHLVLCQARGWRCAGLGGARGAAACSPGSVMGCDPSNVPSPCERMTRGLLPPLVLTFAR